MGLEGANKSGGGSEGTASFFTEGAAGGAGSIFGAGAFEAHETQMRNPIANRMSSIALEAIVRKRQFHCPRNFASARSAEVESSGDGNLWFRTGDTVTRDVASTHFRILDRTSQDIVKSGGYKRSALEIEESLREHPAVHEVSVVGRADRPGASAYAPASSLRHRSVKPSFVRS